MVPGKFYTAQYILARNNGHRHYGLCSRHAIPIYEIQPNYMHSHNNLHEDKSYEAPLVPHSKRHASIYYWDGIW